MSNNIKADEICFEEIADEIKLDPSSIKKFFKKKYCICNKLVLFFALYCSLIVGLFISFMMIFFILIIPFFQYLLEQF